MTEKEYRKLELVSYSSLSKLASSPQAFLAKSDEESSYMVLGSVVDLLLTGSQKEFDENVYVMTASIPGSDMMQKYCVTLAETGDSNVAYLNSGFKLNADAVSKKFDKEGKAYYDALRAGQGKMIIGAEDMMKANEIANQLRTNPFTKGYFIEEENTELRFQVDIVWEVQYTPVEGGDPRLMKVKSLLDVVHIDHANGMITPIDLKTGAEGFFKSYWRWKRYLQASMYTDALRQISLMQRGDRDNRIDHYTVNPLKFVFADTNLYHAPIVYASTEDDIAKGRDGQPYRLLANNIPPSNFGYDGRMKYKGYKQLIAELDWHQRNDIWDYSYDDYQNMGERQIDAFSIKL